MGSTIGSIYLLLIKNIFLDMHISSTITEWHTIMHVIQIELELDLKLKVVV